MHHSALPDHAHHDLTLIAGHAAGDLTNTDTAAAAALLSSCDSCAEAHRDLVAIASVTRALPRTARAPRDFRLTAEQAARLQRGSWLRSILQPFATARSATRPVAAAFTSVGVAGLLVAVLLPGVLGGLGGAAAGPSTESIYGAGAASQAPVPPPANPELDLSSGRPVAAGAPATAEPIVKNADPSDFAIAAGGDSGTGDRDGGQAGGLQAGTDENLAAASPPNLLLIGSLALLVVGIAMFGLRFAARRLR